MKKITIILKVKDNLMKQLTGKGYSALAITFTTLSVQLDQSFAVRKFMEPQLIILRQVHMISKIREKPAVTRVAR